MEKIDLRHLNNSEIHLIKKQVIRMHMQGYKPKEISESVGITIARTYFFIREYKSLGEVKKPNVRGRKPESFMILTPEQEKEIKRIIIDKYPDQLKFSYALWTRQAVCELIKNKYGIEISLRVMTNYLKRWDMTCQRPTKKAYSQDNVKVEKFKKEEYPAIKKLAIKENAVIYWGDETGINKD
jgi:transposase